ncbi:MAG: hypothetical protein M1829_006599 [Trizodia sp. TS-e1964]|nr:MAG: hypothetical protein M1829_006599 [Trizodia sp. TS-e1964]
MKLLSSCTALVGLAFFQVVLASPKQMQYATSSSNAAASVSGSPIQSANSTSFSTAIAAAASSSSLATVHGKKHKHKANNNDKDSTCGGSGSAKGVSGNGDEPESKGSESSKASKLVSLSVASPKTAVIKALNTETMIQANPSQDTATSTTVSPDGGKTQAVNAQNSNAATGTDGNRKNTKKNGGNKNQKTNAASASVVAAQTQAATAQDFSSPLPSATGDKNKNVSKSKGNTSASSTTAAQGSTSESSTSPVQTSQNNNKNNGKNNNTKGSGASSTDLTASQAQATQGTNQKGGKNNKGGKGGAKNNSKTSSANTENSSATSSANATQTSQTGNGKNHNKGGKAGNGSKQNATEADPGLNLKGGKQTQKGLEANNNSNASVNALTLLAELVQTGSESDGLDAKAVADGRTASEKSNNNFINRCLGKTLTNGLQVLTGSCNGIPMGDIPARTNMVSQIITSPLPGSASNLKANQTFTISVQTANLNAGTFTNPQTTYYAAPQQLSGGNIIGHTHITVQDLGKDMNPTAPLRAETFSFFLGVNDKGNGKGLLSATVKGGLKAGNYRICVMGAASNHQPVLSPVAQRGGQDDCIRMKIA